MISIFNVFKKKPIERIQTHREIGNLYELRAQKYFLDLGWEYIEKNFYSRLGEIDLIFWDKDKTLVFVEVRYRASSMYGIAQATVSQKKQEKIIKTAMIYLKDKKMIGNNIRFDVIALSPQQIEHIPNAFSAEGYLI